MIRYIFSSTSPWRKILLLGLFALIGLLLGSIISLPFVDIGGTSSDWALRAMTFISSLFTFILPAILLAGWYSDRKWDYLGFRRTRWSNIGVALLVTIVALPGLNLLMSINDIPQLPQWMLEAEESAERVMKLMVDNHSPLAILANIIVISLMAGFGEEMFFRGLMQRHLTRITRNQVASIIITALIFSAIHFQFKGFLARFALGAILGYLYAYSGSLWVAITAHAFNNFLAITGMMLGLDESPLDTVGTLQQLWPLGLASIALTIFLLRRLLCNTQPTEIALDAEESNQDEFTFATQTTTNSTAEAEKL